MSTIELELRIAELKSELLQRDEKIKELLADRVEARYLVDEMHEQSKEEDQARDNWIEVFDMLQDDSGVWQFDRQQSQLWDRHIELLENHKKLIADWNKFVPQYNAEVAPKDIGRPLKATDAQQADVLKLRKAGRSLRAIVAETGVRLRTVRTIVEKADGTDRTSKKRKDLRRLEFDRQRAAAFRARKARRDAIPKQVADLAKASDALSKRVKGLGKV